VSTTTCCECKNRNFYFRVCRLDHRVLLIKTMPFTSANRNKFGIQFLVLWIMTSYILVGVSMYQRNMLPPSSGLEWVGWECSQMEACSTDNFYHSRHFNSENVAACFSEIFVNITWRLKSEYSLLWKWLLCVWVVLTIAVTNHLPKDTERDYQLSLWCMLLHSLLSAKETVWLKSQYTHETLTRVFQILF